MKKNLSKARSKSPFQKLNLKIKLSTLLLYFMIFALYAKNSSTERTRITLNLENVSVRQIMDEIENSTEFTFVYKVKEINTKRTLSINVNEQPIQVILKKVFFDTNTTYQVNNVDKQVHLSKGVISRLKSTREEDVFQEKISGTVSDNKGNLLAGASIVEKGSNNGAISDFEGNYSINISDKNAVLIVSYIGFQQQHVAVGSNAVVNVILLPSSQILDEVVLTALKRESSLKDTPISVAVLGTQEISDRQITDFTDLVDALPGVAINSAYGGTENSFIAIRGIGGADDYKPNGNPSVALHLDGVYQTSNAYLSMPLFDIDRIEVLKGPQGTLYGRNTTAGAINAITKGPTDEVEGYVNVQHGSYNFFSAEAAIGGPITDRFGIRVAVQTKQGGGFMKGAGAGRFSGFVPEGFKGVIPPVADPGVRDGFGDADLFAIRTTMTYQFEDDSDLNFKFYTSRDRGDTRQYDRVALEDDPKKSRNAGENNDPYEFYTNEYFAHKINVTGFSSKYHRNVNSNLNMDLIASYQKSDRLVGGNGDGTSFPRYQYAFDDKLDQSSFEVRMSDQNGGKLDWLAGIFFVNDYVQFTSNWNSLGVLSQYTSPYEQRRKSFATFVNSDWHISNELTLSAGLRYTNDDVKFKGKNIDLDPWGTSKYQATFKSPAPFSWDRDFEDDNVSGKLTVKYDFTNKLNLFASAGKGYRGGGFDGTSIFSAEETEPFDSETVIAYEMGLRYFTGRITMSLDAFKYSFKELQATARLSNDTNGRTNVGKAEVQGAEAAITALVFGNDKHTLKYNGAVTFLDSKITEFKSNRVDDVKNTIGDQLPGAPKWSATSSLRHMLSISKGTSLNTRIDFTHHGEESNRLNAGASNTAEGYNLLGARMGVDFVNGMSFYVYGRNILDEIYFLEANAGERLVGAPATYGGGIRYNF
ncbi:TonB-dependent receptor [Maribacter sp.]|uniref:TonB-dependent receptor n=1 Tax=Maribacter sp. TaxID=1897614 RepID=UPI0025C1DD4A|nr:TonB-dependent receptor [Maribacter sp.]